MKKLLNISVIAALAVLPMAANADPTTGTTGDNAPITTNNAPTYKGVALNNEVDGSLATAGYVKGAYNDAIKAVNKVYTTVTTGEATLTNKTIDADDNTIQDLTTTNFKSGTVVTSIGDAEGVNAATNTELPTALAVRNAIDAVAGTANSAVQEITTGETDGTISVDGTEVSVAGLGSAAFTDSTDYATAAQGALAESAVQEITTGETDGTISVDGTEVSVAGLGSAAFTDSTDYATAAQGALAESALQAADLADYAKKTGVVDTITHSTVTTTAATGTVTIMDTWGSDSTSSANVSIPALTGSIATAVGGYSEPAANPSQGS